jgi:hypothetical protein
MRFIQGHIFYVKYQITLGLQLFNYTLQCSPHTSQAQKFPSHGTNGEIIAEAMIIAMKVQAATEVM